MTIVQSNPRCPGTSNAKKIYVETEDFDNNLSFLPDEDVSVQDVFTGMDESFVPTNPAIDLNSTHRIGDGSDHSVVQTNAVKLATIEEGAEVNPNDAEVKTAYENNTDTNAFTDDEKTNLGNQSNTNTGDQDITGIATNTTDITNLKTGWTTYTGTMPAYNTTTNGVDSITLVNANNFLQKGAKVELTSTAGTHTYYVSDARNSGFDVNGETSVSGTIIAMKYSYADCPFGFKKGEDWFKARMYRDSDVGLSTFNAWTKVGAGSIDYDPNNNCDVTTNYRYDVPITCTMNIFSISPFQSLVVTDINTAIFINGSRACLGNRDSTSSVSSDLIASAILKVNRGDYIEIYTYVSGTAGTRKGNVDKAETSYGVQFTGV